MKLLLFLLLISFHSISQNCPTTSTIITGIYQGKNLFFQILEKNSIKSIYLNNEKVNIDFKNENFELILTKLNQNENYEIKIEYCENSKTPYKILNSEVLK